MLDLIWGDHTVLQYSRMGQIMALPENGGHLVVPTMQICMENTYIEYKSTIHNNFSLGKMTTLEGPVGFAVQPYRVTMTAK